MRENATYVLKDKFGETVMRTLVDEPFIYSTRNGAQIGKRLLEAERKEKLTIHRL